jgi:hypothetical protein
VTTTAHTCWTLSPDGTEMFVLYGGVVVKPSNTNAPPTAPRAPEAIAASGTPAVGANNTPGTRRARPGGFARRVLFLDRMEILPDGTLVAHSPTVTPQPYPSADKSSYK